MVNNRFAAVAGSLLVIALVARASAAQDAPDPNTQREFGAKLQVCGACHGNDGVPKGPSIPVIWGHFMGANQNEGAPTPRLAGQSYDYLVSAMNRFANGERTNNADMVQIMKGISPANREAMALYLSSL